MFWQIRKRPRERTLAAFSFESFIRLWYLFRMNKIIIPLDLKDIVRFNIRARRKELGMTQQRLAEIIDAYQPNIAQIESGANSPTLDNLAKIAMALGVSPDLLLRAELFSEIPT